jgi:glycosyltransferase involved in cell wall biosynthesis
MRVLMLLKYPLFGSGSGTYARKLAEKLAVLYPKDEFAIMTPDYEHKVPGVKIFPFNPPFYAASTGHPAWPDAKIYSQLTPQEIDQIYIHTLTEAIKVVNKFKPDVIHVHHALYMTWIANYLRAIYGMYYLVTVHGTDVLTASENKRWISLTKDALTRAWLINTVSNDTKKWLLKVYKKSGISNKIKIIPGGVDVEHFPRQAPIKIIDKKYKLKNKKVVIFVGKLTAKKGVSYLIKAAPKIKGEIFIIGDGEEKPQLIALAEKLRIKNVHFLGYFGESKSEELKEFYRRANVFVFPSVWDEPLGLVALEAMACGTPVVASKKGGIPLTVKNGVNGFLVRARSAKAIAEKVNLILDNPELEQKLSEAARRIVEEKFSWTKIAERFYNYYLKAYEDSQKRLVSLKLPLDISRERKEIKNRKLELK